ncbi:hypothetical protein [Spirosoma rhododendri]|uniref:DUF4153 domain-containing protein n=1 Tax=Spirosoma rhododendri TaxID=2728024 RepID=A0A7L5DMV4_9BACT|nr:hypothetical protein [Spirosoma rhododendri]QJD79814.1 hypothetical protein HH216_16375 [Spirosoma rhododendri]
MRDDILLNLDNPRQLEHLYRTDKPMFKTAFESLYPQMQGSVLAEAWHQRLTYSRDLSGWGAARDRTFVLLASLIAAFLAKLPALFSLDNERFYSRNVGFIVFPVLLIYFARKTNVSRRTGIWLAGLVGLSVVYINLLPQSRTSDTLVLACLYSPLWLWSLLGFAFGGGTFGKRADGLGFLRYNGDLAVMSALLLIAGGLTSALTINLFRLIGWNIADAYFNYIVVCGLAMVPVVATFLTQVQPTLVGLVSPVIARLFTPVVLVILLIYLVAMLASGKDPYHDREFLLLFNALLIGVMALIFFSLTGTNVERPGLIQLLILLLLSIVTVLINSIALSAILFRISEWGFTPNRTAVLGSNLLILAHLLVVGVRLWQTIARQTDLSRVNRAMTVFLPAYSVWSAIVTFVFPLLFGFR